MTGKGCKKILDALMVNDQGELALDEAFRKHLDECPQCHEIYRNIQMARTEAVPDYVPGTMQRLREGCSAILERMVVDVEGEIVVEENFRDHLDSCPQCRKLYDRIEAARLEEVPNYVPEVMKKIRDMEMTPLSSTWLERVSSFLTVPVIFRPRVWVPSIAALTIAVLLIMTFGLPLFPGRIHKDDYENLVGIDRSKALERFVDVDKQISDALDRYVSEQVELFQEDL